MEIYEQAISVLIGVLSSFITWFLLNKFIKPKVNFSEFISDSERGERTASGRVYTIRIENKSVFSNIIDIRCYFRLYIPKRDGHKEEMLTVVNIKSGVREFPYIKRKPIFGKPNEKKHHFKTLPIVEPIVEFGSKDLPGNYTYYSLKEFFDQVPGGKLKLILIGYDSLTGSKAVLESKFYDAGDLREGRFTKFDLTISSQNKK
jgi:hypothetical protein